MARLLACLALLLLLAPLPSRAQRPPATITGRVMILDSMRPAAGALVRIEALGVGATTDSAGRYRMVVPSARITDGESVEITASRPGLVPEQQRISLAAGDQLVVDFAGKTWRGPEASPCYGLMRGIVGPPRDPVTDEKLCVLTVLLGERGPRTRRPPP